MLQKDVNSTFQVALPSTVAVIALVNRFGAIENGLYAFEYWIAQNGSTPTVDIQLGHDGVAGANDLQFVGGVPTLYRVRGQLVVVAGFVTIWAEYQDNAALPQFGFGSGALPSDGTISPIIRIVNTGSDNLDLTVTGWFGQLQGGLVFP